MEHHSELRGKALRFLLFLWFLWFLNFTIRSMFSPLLPLIEDEFAISHARASSIFLFLSTGYAISVFLSGVYAGRVGYKRTVVFSLLVSSVASFTIPFIKAFPLFYLIAFALGFAVGLYLPSAIPLITEHLREKDWPKSIAIHDSGASIAIFATPLIALFLLSFVQWRGIFAIFAVVCLMSAVIFHLVGDEVKIGGHAKDTRFNDIITSRSFWAIAIISTFAAGANIGIYLIGSLYLTKELSLSIHYADTVLGISRLGGVGASVLAGFLAGRAGLKKIMFTMLFVAGIFTVLMGAAPTKWMGIVLFLQASFVTGFFPLSIVSIAKMSGREARGMTTGLVMTISTILGGGLTPYLLGLSGDLVSFRFGISALGILVLLSSGFVFFLKELE